MLVEYWMKKKKTVITIDAGDSMLDATRKLKEHGIRHLPVLKKGKLVGIVTDRDLKKASPSEATTLEVHELLYLLANIKVEEIMTKNPFTVPYNYSVEEAAQILLEKKISGLPVVDDEGNVIGIITQTDIFKVLIALTGIGKRGLQFGLLIEDRPNAAKEIGDVIRSHGGRIASLLSSYERAPEGYRNVFVRAFEVDREKIEAIKEGLRKSATKLLYVIDHRENKREIFPR
ncbi:MAG: CBS and ACT domain-containing protein [Thermodesulfobacteriota bacterium]